MGHLLEQDHSHDHPVLSNSFQPSVQPDTDNRSFACFPKQDQPHSQSYRPTDLQGYTHIELQSLRDLSRAPCSPLHHTHTRAQAHRRGLIGLSRCHQKSPLKRIHPMMEE